MANTERQRQRTHCSTFIVTPPLWDALTCWEVTTVTWFRDKSCLSADLGLWLWLKTLFLLLLKSDESVKGDAARRCALELITSHLFVFDQSGSSFPGLPHFPCRVLRLRRSSQNIHGKGSQDEMDELLITGVFANCRKKYKIIVFVGFARFKFFCLADFSFFCPSLQPGAAPLKIWRMVNSP